MGRLTEYHNGVAVIRDKSLLKEAMRKLAGYEDAEEDSDMEKITTEFAEYICDNLCQYPEKCFDDEDLDECCDKCKLGKFICDICNGYNRLNRFVGSELEKVMKKSCKLEKELQAYKDLEEQGRLIVLPCKVGDTLYQIRKRYTKCSEYNQEFEESLCCGCEVECDSVAEWYVDEFKASSNQWVVKYMDWLGKIFFLTKEEAEKALAEMEK